LRSLDRRLPTGFLEEALRADARTGLTAEPKSLPPKWFYDAQGSALFDKITELPEYYPTRAEREILRVNAAGIAAQTGARTLIELGSGSSDKTRLLLDALRDAGTLRCYVPVDVSEPALAAAGKALSAEYPGLDVRAVVSDFEERLGFPADAEAPAPRLVAFLGSTIGNLEPGQRSAFLARVRDRLRPGDFFLLGTDLVKDPATLVAAYDDEAGVTAEFNKNVLAVLNAELGADFDLDAFEHVAVWNADAEWIEMRLRSSLAQIVRLPGIGLTVEFAEGEEMRTEISAKFRREGVAAELGAAGFAMRSWWTDSADQFGLSLSVPAPGPGPALAAQQLTPEEPHPRGIHALRAGQWVGIRSAGSPLCRRRWRGRAGRGPDRSGRRTGRRTGRSRRRTWRPSRCRHRWPSDRRFERGRGRGSRRMRSRTGPGGGRSGRWSG
jgi:L-histidine Nalpha-methyltransferase